MSGNQVRDWMTLNPVTISQGTLLREAHWLMIDNKVRRLPVMDGEHLVGIVTKEDLRRAEPSIGICLDLVKITDMLSRMTVRQLMTKDLQTVSSEAPLLEAARMMLEHEISALPVIEAGQLVGIITESDIFRAYVRLEQKKQYSTT
jgi:acetoin utilization protein AcuB